jgi:hypothetical protein
MKTISKFLLAALLIMSVGCLDLDVSNLNDPNNETVLSDEGNLTSITSSIFYGVFRGYYTNDPSTTPFSVNISLDFLADHTTMTNNFCSWWLLFKQEPRQVLDNSIAWPNKAQVVEPFNAWNGVVVNANTIINTLEAKAELSDQLKGLLASVYFCRAMALGYLANIYDKSYVVPLDATGYEPVLVPYSEVLTESLANFDKAIELFETVPDFELPQDILNGLGYDAAQMIALSKTYYAHFLVSSSRTAAQNAAVDWAKVKTYVTEGIEDDFVINADGVNFLHIFQANSGLFWYFRVDHRVMRHFNANLPKRFPNNTDAPNSPYTEAFLKGTGYTGDKRLDAYFQFETDMSFFRAARNDGILRSHYRIKRYDVLYNNTNVGPSVIMYSYANQLYLAEAEAMLNNPAGAVAILNNPAYPRKAVGEMADLSAALTKQQVLDVIFAERDIELGRTEFAISFTDMRRKDALQIGTLLHLPVPADELTTTGIPVYTFGGVGNADGVNTASGSNSWTN